MHPTRIHHRLAAPLATLALAAALLAGSPRAQAQQQQHKKTTTPAPVAKKQPAAAPAAPAAPAADKLSYPGPAPAVTIANPVATVGSGGVAKSEYDWYLLKTANKLNKSVAALTSDEKKIGLNLAIEDELLFQAALAEGALKDDYVCRMLVDTYKSTTVTAKIDPSAFTDDELQKYYRAHPEKFATPATVAVKGLKFVNASDEEVQRVLQQVKTNPEAITNWVNLGTFTEGQASAGLPPQIANAVTKLNKGQNSGIVTDRGSGWKYIFLVTDRSEATVPPFADVRSKVRFEYIAVKQEELKKTQLAQTAPAGQKPQSEEQQLLGAAVQAGMHRELQTKQYIINAYVMRKQAKREQLLPPLKTKFPVQVLSKG